MVNPATRYRLLERAGAPGTGPELAQLLRDAVDLIDYLTEQVEDLWVDLEAAQCV